MSTSRAKSSWKLCEFVAHSSTVNCLALSPSNGRTLATGGDDRRINLWMVGQPNALMSISGITSPVQSVAFNNTENWIGAGSKSGVIKVFDLEENKAVRSISGHKAAIRSLDFHRYGDILASGSMDTNLKLWDVRRKGCIFTYKGHSEVLNCIQFSPDGKWIVSASSDCTIKVWDLSAGRMIADFKNHTGAVMSVQFHPKEFLLASGSSDRTAKFWDLENFRLVSETAPEATGIRCIQYHPEGVALFSGAQDSLRVYGWEPAVTHDALPIHWGKVADMAMSGEQLIGASFAQTNVSLWCIDQKKLKLFSGTSVSPTEREVSPPLSASGRRLFEYQREEVASERHSTQASQPKTQEQQPQQRPPSEEGKEGGDSPPMELREEERKQIFEKRLKLVRTPPKRTHDPFQPPVDDNPPAVVPPADRPSSQHPRVEPSQDPTNDIIRAFKAPVQSQPSKPSHSKDSRVVGEIQTNHTDVCQILKSRLSILKKARSEWSVSDPKTALEVAINSGNQSALMDLLNVLHLKRTLWTLDMAVAILPELRLLFKSKYEAYIVCGCNILKLILKSFGPLIKTNLASPPSQGAQGVDITREERYEKCHICHSHIMSLREDIWRLQKGSGLSIRSMWTSLQELYPELTISASVAPGSPAVNETIAAGHDQGSMSGDTLLASLHADNDITAVDTVCQGMEVQDPELAVSTAIDAPLSIDVTTVDQQISSVQDQELDDSDHLEVHNYLFPLVKEQMCSLGIVMGLNYTKLRHMMDSTPVTFNDDVIAAWLRREDDVERRGAPSRQTLVAALRHPSLGQNGIADTIANEKGFH